MARFFKAFFFLLILPLTLFPQYQNLKFEHISVEQGLSHTKVFCIFQDSKGFMWFGTEDGLNKYDGYKFTVYRHDPADSSTLGSGNARDVYEDRSGNLWITTTWGGISRFDREAETFTRYIHNRNNPASIPSNSTDRITSLIYGDKEIFWIGTSEGLCKFDPQSEQFTHFPHTDKRYPYSYIDAMIVDSAGKIWLGTTADGLHRFDPETGKYTSFRHDSDLSYSLSSNRVVSLLWDKSGKLWVGTEDGGLNRFDPENNKFLHYQMDSDNRYALNSNWVLSILEDRSGDLWLSTATGGLNILDRRTEKFTSFMHDPGDPYSISDNTVMCTFEDKSGALWVGTWGGVNKIDPRKSQFVDIKQRPGDPNSLSDSFIWSLCESNFRGQPALWIGTKTNGLNKLDLVSGNIEQYKNDPDNPNSIPSNLISALFEDHSGLLWIGTYGEGLIKYDQQSKKFTRYIHDPNNAGSINGNIIRCINEDSFGVIWIGFQGVGVDRFDKNTEKFTHIIQRYDHINIYEDKSGNLWIATGILKKLDRTREKFTYYEHNPEDPSSLSSSSATVIYETFEDGQQVLWVGTEDGGLNRLDPRLGKFKNYTIDNGLPSNVINGILEDNDGNLWLSTNNGLSKFNPRNETFRNYDVADGLLGNMFNFRACCKTADGQMFFGGTKGLNAFYPDRLKDNLYIPEIVFTDFQIFNKPVGIKNDKTAVDKDNYLLEKHISELQSIELSYRENVFSFEFAALDYHSPQNNQYAYKMDGIDPDWVFTNASRRFATYTNLDPGEYIFTVKGSNNDGIWNEEGTSIKIVITPPWWRTNLAYTFYLFFIGVVAYGFWRFQTISMKMKQQMEMERFEAEKLREVDTLKSRFFANISHEFRTPLTLIVGPIKQILSGELKENLTEHYKMILRNSGRLLKLINQLLDLSKLENGKLKLQAQAKEIINHTKGLVQTFESMAVIKGIELKFRSDLETQEIYIDIDKYEKIINNLLSNAFKFSLKDGVVEVNISHSSISPLSKAGLRRIKISISNTGPGIPADHIDKIFDRFYQVDDSYTIDGKGTGIGLALTKELVELHYGEIMVESIPGEKTTFTILLPIGKEHFKDNRLINTAEQISDTDSSLKMSVLELSKPDIESIESERKETIPENIKNFPIVLIVEDNTDLRQYIKNNLNQQYNILEAENGEEGFSIASEKIPDMIISDVMMPKMDGFEFCNKIKTDERTSHIPVILLTARAAMKDKIEGLETGADDYLTKPFEAKEVLVRVNNLIDQRNKLREKYIRMMEIEPAEIAATSTNEKFIKRLLDVFENHVAESDFSTEDFASEVGMSRSNLHRKLQALTNQPTHEFLLTLRLKRAAQLLKISAASITEVAYAVGFNNPSHFAKMFRKHFGKSPREFTSKNQTSK